MQRKALYVDTGSYLNPIRGEGANSNTDVDVVPRDSHRYEELQDQYHHYEHLRHIPHGTGDTSSKSPKNKGREQKPNLQSAEPTADGTQTKSSSCLTPVCWRWAVLITVLLIAAVLTAILVVNLTSKSTNANPTTTDGKTTRSTEQSTPFLTVLSETTSTGPTNPRAKNCQEVHANGGRTSGVYSIYPDGQMEVRVYCEQTLRGGGWTVFQRRMDGSVDFYRDWADYKAGFGAPSGEYWVGNDNLHTLTANMDTQLLVELQHAGETQYAQYTEFWVHGEDQNFQLHVSGYIKGGVCGDSITFHSGHAFTTRDRDSSENCAQQRSGAWWYHVCTNSNLNGLYGNDSKKGITWFSWKGAYTSLSAVRMFLKTK